MRRETIVLMAVIACGSLTARGMQQASRPTFRTEVEYVEIDARVLDAAGNVIRDLTKDRFQVLENGEPQDITTFSFVDMPIRPPLAASSRVPALTATPDVATNQNGVVDGRVYLLLLDDWFISASRTPMVRKMLRDFIEQHINPPDLVAVMKTTQLGFAFQNFTTDKSLMLRAIEQLFGEGRGSPTTQRLTSFDYKVETSPNAVRPDDRISPGQPGPGQTGRESAQTLAQVVRFMAGMSGGSKAIIYVGEGSSLDAVTDAENLGGLADDLLGAEAASRANVPIYTVDPRGLTALQDEAIEITRVKEKDAPTVPLLQELQRSRQRLRSLSADTGGFALVGSNDFDGGFARIVRQASSYYALGYYPKNTKRDGKYRKVEVKVSRQDARILARRGYMAASTRESKTKPPLPGLPGASERAREAIISPLPVTGFALSATAAAFRDRGPNASVAVVLEGSGADLTLTGQNGAFTGSLEVLVTALQTRGAIAASEVKQLQFKLPPDVFDRVRQNGFRWLSRLALKPGNYQIRIAASSEPAKRGSVWYDLVIPDFSKGKLAISDILLASASAFQTPTIKPDPALGDALPGPPTTVRDFPSGDEIAVFAEIYDNALADGRDLDVTVTIADAQAQEVARTTATQSHQQMLESKGVYRSRTILPLKTLTPGAYALTIEGRRRNDNSAPVGRVIPFRITAR